MPEPEEQPAPQQPESALLSPPRRCRRCRRCDYDITGLEDGSMCPDCAEVINLQRENRPWAHAALDERGTLMLACLTAAFGHILTLVAARVYYTNLVRLFRNEGMVDLGAFTGGAIGMLAAAIIGGAVLAMIFSPDNINPPAEAERRRTKARKLIVRTAFGIFIWVVIAMAISRGELLGLLIVALPTGTLMLAIAFIGCYQISMWLCLLLHAAKPSTPLHVYKRPVWLMLLGPAGAAILMTWLGIQILRAKPEVGAEN